MGTRSVGPVCLRLTGRGARAVPEETLRPRGWSRPSQRGSERSVGLRLGCGTDSNTTSAEWPLVLDWDIPDADCVRWFTAFTPFLNCGGLFFLPRGDWERAAVYVVQECLGT